MSDFQTVQMRGDDGEWYDVPAPVARKIFCIQSLVSDMIGVLDYGEYPKSWKPNIGSGVVPALDEVFVDEIREAFAIELARKIRSSTGKFQMMREAVAQWLEEGEWK
jgi:hypothetical protein